MIVRLIAVGVEGAVNLGFIARLVKNFDVDEFFIVSPRVKVEEAIRYAARAYDVLLSANRVDNLEDALDNVDISFCSSAKTSKGNDVLRSPITPWEMAEIAAKRGGRIAVVVGRESTGLTRHEIRLCDLLVNIPSSAQYKALNLSNATAILLYELYKVREKGIPRINADKDVMKLIKSYMKAIVFSTINEEKREDVEIALERILAKSLISREEAKNLLYVLSKVCNKVEGCRSALENFIDRKSRY